MHCKRCHRVKSDLVRVDNLIICSDCINLIVLEWDIRLMDTNDRDKVRLSPVLRTGFQATPLHGVKFTSVAA